MTTRTIQIKLTPNVAEGRLPLTCPTLTSTRRRDGVSPGSFPRVMIDILAGTGAAAHREDRGVRADSVAGDGGRLDVDTGALARSATPPGVV